MDALLAELRNLLVTARLSLEADGDGWLLTGEHGARRIAGLPLDDVDPLARRAELLAVASGLEAAVKIGTPVEDSAFVAGAANLLPQIERTRFVTAHDAASDDPLVHRPLGADLSVVYVRDGGWRFHYVGAGQRERWDVSPGTIDAGARSNLYHRAEVPYHERVVSLGDGYDAARLLLASEVFYHLDEGEGVMMATPGRDVLLVGEATAETLTRFDASPYPLSPHRLVVTRGAVTVAP
ncbi:MAG: hypothetical protein QF464_03575 [Myxococcota bacterium]|jgi:hypothetical protein|nr:hypothetical protein [Myxococcota bacterium]